MGAILMRAACFILIIILGTCAAPDRLFKKDDFYVLSKTVLKNNTARSDHKQHERDEDRAISAGPVPAGIWGRRFVHDGFVSSESQSFQGKEGI